MAATVKSVRPTAASQHVLLDLGPRIAVSTGCPHCPTRLAFEPPKSWHGSKRFCMLHARPRECLHKASATARGACNCLRTRYLWLCLRKPLARRLPAACPPLCYLELCSSVESCIARMRPLSLTVIHEMQLQLHFWYKWSTRGRSRKLNMNPSGKGQILCNVRGWRQYEAVPF